MIDSIKGFTHIEIYDRCDFFLVNCAKNKVDSSSTPSL